MKFDTLLVTSSAKVVENEINSKIASSEITLCENEVLLVSEFISKDDKKKQKVLVKI